MIVSEHPQRSDEWFKERLGLPTASHFEQIVTTTGARSKQREKYMYELAGEILTGRQMVRYATQKMRNAVEREPEARAFYSLVKGVYVQEVGLCYLDDRKLFGASPDGLVGDDGGLELKDAEPHVQIDRIRNGWSKADHFQQVQGCLYVTGRKWWDLMSYCEGMEPVIIRFERDEKFISALSVELALFCSELQRLVKTIKEKNG